MLKKTIVKDPMNVWNKYDFAMSGLGRKSRLLAKIRHFGSCIGRSRQRIVRGYSDYDVWEMCSFLQTLIPDMLQTLKDTRTGSPGHLGENYVNDDGILENDTCHREWDEILDRMIFLWREIDADTCSKKNRYEEEYLKTLEEFEEKYGLLGKELQTEEELEENKRLAGEETTHTVHFMEELPEYREISENYRREERRLEEYRKSCKNEAFDMLKEYFFDLWD